MWNGEQGIRYENESSPVVVVDCDEYVVHGEPTVLAGVGAKGRQQGKEVSGLLQGQGLMLNHALDNLQAGHLGGFVPVNMRDVGELKIYLRHLHKHNESIVIIKDEKHLTWATKISHYVL